MATTKRNHTFSTCWLLLILVSHVFEGWTKRKRAEVPTFDQLIASSGPSDIGIHVDVFKASTLVLQQPSTSALEDTQCNHARTESDGNRKQSQVPVHTYLTAVRGCKMVIIIPPVPGSEELFKVQYLLQ